MYSPQKRRKYSQKWTSNNEGDVHDAQVYKTNFRREHHFFSGIEMCRKICKFRGIFAYCRAIKPHNRGTYLMQKKKQVNKSVPIENLGVTYY